MALVPTRVLIVGASGYLGTKIMNAFIAKKATTTAAMSLQALSRTPRTSPGVQWVVGDMMQPQSLDAALQGVDVVVSSANGYMKGSIKTDFEGNSNLIEAAARANVKRFVLLSITSCDQATNVPHFYAKYVAERHLEKSGVPWVAIRAPAFFDQSYDVDASSTKAGRFVAVGDTSASYSYVCTSDLAEDMVRAALHPNADILGRTIDVGWGPLTPYQLAKLIEKVTGRKLTVYTVPWLAVNWIGSLVGLFSPLARDMVAMFSFFRKGTYVSDTKAYTQVFGLQPPTAEEAVTKWAKETGLVK